MPYFKKSEGFSLGFSPYTRGDASPFKSTPASRIKDAKRNAKRNKIDNIKFYASDVGKFLRYYPEYVGKIKTVILDPPRAGIAPKTLMKIISLEVENIVYISCNPSTQARDTSILIDQGYLLQKISFVDQFPHTGHIESIAKYKKVK